MQPPNELDLVDALVRQSNTAICWYLANGIAIPPRLVEADYLINSVQDGLRVRFGTHDEEGEPIR